MKAYHKFLGGKSVLDKIIFTLTFKKIAKLEEGQKEDAQILARCRRRFLTVQHTLREWAPEVSFAQNRTSHILIVGHKGIPRTRKNFLMNFITLSTDKTNTYNIKFCPRAIWLNVDA